MFHRRAHIVTAQWLTFEAKANFTGFSTTERDLQVRQYWVIPVKPFQLKLVLNLETGLHTWLVPWKVGLVLNCLHFTNENSYILGHPSERIKQFR